MRSGLRRWLEVNLAAVAAGAFFLPWHTVHKTNALEGFSLFGPASTAQPPPVHDTGEWFTCTGFSHYDSAVLPLLLGALVVVCVVARDRPALPWSPLKVALGVAIAAYTVYAKLLAHMFDRVETHPPEPLFAAAVVALILVAFGRTVAGIVAFFRGRRRSALA
jgi:hypothetical protein